MQKQISRREFAAKEFLDTLRRQYYFFLGEKFRLFQRASFLFVLLVPMFAILFQLFKTYETPRFFEFIFLFLLTGSLFSSVIFLLMSILIRFYFHLESPDKLLQYYNKYKEKIVKELALEYQEAIINNQEIISKRSRYLWWAHLNVAFFAITLLVFFIYTFIKNWYFNLVYDDFYKFFEFIIF